ncbi:MAG: modification methylase, HemK family protein [Candidatus Saccharibacteria bacterium]|nr:modification methylase, HemK family protein [Candidatus Saccharibacteria bacterium]
MNANLPSNPPKYETWLAEARKELKDVGIASYRLDSEIILAHTVKQPRSFLHAHPETRMTDREYEIANARLELRLEHVPVAYIIGHKEFYGRRFMVTTATLIPRPESEALIELLREVQPKSESLLTISEQLVDVGTGSGCLGITAKLEFPHYDVTLIDNSRHALTVAERNIKQCKADVTTLRSDLLAQYPYTADVIIANLPYVDESWERSRDTDHEPTAALFAGDNGLALIKKLITQTHVALASQGHVILEADPRQHEAIIHFAKQNQLKHLTTLGYGLLFQKTI